MKRREFLGVLGGAAAWPPKARAQQAQGMRRVGALFAMGESDPEGQARAAAFREGIAAVRVDGGSNLRMDYRWAGGSAERMRPAGGRAAARRWPEVLLAGATTALLALQRATRRLPVVFAQVTDPVGAGFVDSLARPGGNITGITQHEFTME